MGVLFTTSSAPGRSCADDPCQPRASDSDSSLTGFHPLDCPLRLRVDDAFACYRGKDWIDAWGTQQSCSASRHATLASHLYANREPAPEEQSPRRSPGLALRSDQRSRRLTDRQQLLSWNPGPARGSYPSLLASHLNLPWHVVNVQEAPASSPRENFHVITQHHRVVLLNKDTFARDYSCTAIQVPCSLRCSSWAIKGMVVTRKFCRVPDPSCSYFTVANIHINNECAKLRSVCIALLLLFRRCA